MLTATAGFLLAADGHISAGTLIAALLGTALIIASACVVNNYLDRTIDKKMTRTAQRALVSGQVSTIPAIFYAAGLGLGGFILLITTVNRMTAFIGLGGWVAYTGAYSLAKRRTAYGTLVGTISGATPPVAGYTAVTNQLDLAAGLLFLLLVCWQMPHFYTIAIYRLKDYRAAALPILPLAKGIIRTKTEVLTYILGFILTGWLLTIAGYTGNVFAGLISGIGLAWLYKAFSQRGVSDQQWGREMFLFSLKALLVVSLTLSLNPWLP